MRLLTAIISALTVLASCSHKELCYDHNHTLEIEVEFDWSKAPDAEPETMSLYLFSDDSDEARRYEFTDHTKGRIRVMPGTYKAVCLNSDTRNTTIADRSLYESSLIVAKDADTSNGINPMELGTAIIPTRTPEDERLTMSPDSIWTARMEEIVADSLCRKLTFAPEQAFQTIQVSVEDVENIKYLTSTNATLSSLSGGLYLGQNTLHEDKVTIPFGLEVSKDEERLKGELRIFGHCPQDENRHTLTLYCTLTDRSTFTHTYDVTGQLHDDDDHIIEITLEGLELPEPKPGTGEVNGGFQPSVGGWESVDIGIAM